MSSAVFGMPTGNYIYQPYSSRSDNSPSIVETTLDLGARFLVPLRDADTRSLTFGMAALIISSIASFINNVAKEYPGEPIDSDINNNFIENRNGEPSNKLFYYQSELNKMQPLLDEKTKVDKSMSMNCMKRAIVAYEEFMSWTQKETRDNEIILEEVLALAVSKARGTGNPADQLFKFGEEIISYVAGSVIAFISSMMWWNNPF